MGKLYDDYFVKPKLAKRQNSRAARVVDGSEVVVEPHERVKKPRAEEPETVAGLVGEADAPTLPRATFAARLPQKSVDWLERYRARHGLRSRNEALIAVLAEAMAK